MLQNEQHDLLITPSAPQPRQKVLAKQRKKFISLPLVTVTHLILKMADRGMPMLKLAHQFMRRVKAEHEGKCSARINSRKHAEGHQRGFRSAQVQVGAEVGLGWVQPVSIFKCLGHVDMLGGKLFT